MEIITRLRLLVLLYTIYRLSYTTITFYPIKTLFSLWNTVDNSNHKYSDDASLPTDQDVLPIFLAIMQNCTVYGTVHHNCRRIGLCLTIGADCNKYNLAKLHFEKSFRCFKHFHWWFHSFISMIHYCMIDWFIHSSFIRLLIH